jgi:hypothetical protein
LGTSCSKFKYSLVAVNESAVCSLHLGVDLAALLGVKYSSSLLDKPYWSNDDLDDPEAFAEGMRLQLEKL